MFTQFIQECSFVSDRHACLEFFDECVQKVGHMGRASRGGKSPGNKDFCYYTFSGSLVRLVSDYKSVMLKLVYSTVFLFSMTFFIFDF